MAIIIKDSTGNRFYMQGDAHDNSMASEPQMVLLGKFKVDTWCFDSVVLHLKKTLPLLLPDIDYSVQDLLGEDFWPDVRGLPDHLPTLCLQHFAQQPDTPLTASPYYGVGVTTFQLR